MNGMTNKTGKLKIVITGGVNKHHARRDVCHNENTRINYTKDRTVTNI